MPKDDKSAMGPLIDRSCIKNLECGYLEKTITVHVVIVTTIIMVKDRGDHRLGAAIAP